MEKTENIKKWRMVLGKESEESFKSIVGDKGIIALDKEELLMANALDAIYDNSNHELEKYGGAGNGFSAPKISKWLGDIRKIFDKDIVKVIQNDAIERKGMKQLLLEPEVLNGMAPDINLACTLLTLKNQVPERSKESVRQYIQNIVEDINKRINNDVQKAVLAALNKKNHVSRGTASSLDFNYTIRRNLKNFNKDLNKIIPEKMYFFEHMNKANGWNIILDIDQSGSMGESILYSTVMGCILAKMSSVSTRVVAFDTSIVDLTEKYDDPVDMLFGIQLGGGTDIHKSVVYCEQFIRDPKKTLLFLISDLEEWGNQGALINKIKYLKESGVTVVCLLAISDNGEPYYNKDLANKFAKFGVPSFACSPNFLPELLEKALKGEEIRIDKK
ncbi:MULTISPECIES: VWA domain-containing protein [Clostridium]|uniref:VWA domain-containing protein n=1 Tax=Clostridium aquiflavi TaxID=3073603 RepID=A0ABU1EGB0_9CLOT|nr:MULTISPECIES: VWA domain-containing protein [unclassified Clostridium]MDR5587147.1 VWA domain-containing protein [Clostridium sp. 5N-1]